MNMKGERHGHARINGAGEGILFARAREVHPSTPPSEATIRSSQDLVPNPKNKTVQIPCTKKEPIFDGERLSEAIVNLRLAKSNTAPRKKIGAGEGIRIDSRAPARLAFQAGFASLPRFSQKLGSLLGFKFLERAPNPKMDLERAKGFEPSTSTLARLHSTN